MKGRKIDKTFKSKTSLSTIFLTLHARDRSWRNKLHLLILWTFYLSLFTVGQTFLSFQVALFFVQRKVLLGVSSCTAYGHRVVFCLASPRKILTNSRCVCVCVFAGVYVCVCVYIYMILSLLFCFWSLFLY